MRITINTPDGLAQQIESTAKAQGLSVSAYFVKAAEAKLKQDAFERMNQLIGTTQIKESFDDALNHLRQDKPTR